MVVIMKNNTAEIAGDSIYVEFCFLISVNSRGVNIHD